MAIGISKEWANFLALDKAQIWPVRRGIAWLGVFISFELGNAQSVQLAQLISTQIVPPTGIQIVPNISSCNTDYNLQQHSYS